MNEKEQQEIQELKNLIAQLSVEDQMMILEVMRTMIASHAHGK